jgi:hypothetical protein
MPLSRIAPCKSGLVQNPNNQQSTLSGSLQEWKFLVRKSAFAIALLLVVVFLWRERQSGLSEGWEPLTVFHVLLGLVVVAMFASVGVGNKKLQKWAVSAGGLLCVYEAVFYVGSGPYASLILLFLGHVIVLVLCGRSPFQVPGSLNGQREAFGGLTALWCLWAGFFIAVHTIGARSDNPGFENYYLLGGSLFGLAGSLVDFREFESTPTNSEILAREPIDDDAA